MTIEEFIAARLDEDETAAQDAGGDRWAYDGDAAAAAANGEVYRPDKTQTVSYGPGHVGYDYDYVTMDSEGLTPAVDKAEGVHIARQDPKRALYEVECKREILAFHGDAYGDYCRFCSGELEPVPRPCEHVRRIAAVWRDHPDFRPEWAS